jgi:hypothetical protein
MPRSGPRGGHTPCGEARCGFRRPRGNTLVGWSDVPRRRRSRSDARASPRANADRRAQGTRSTPSAARNARKRSSDRREAAQLPTRSKPSKGEAPRGAGGDEAQADRSTGERGEPHGRHQGATNLEPVAGASRRGGAKPRGRNGSRPWSGRPEGSAQAFPGVDGGSEVGGGVKNRRRGVAGREEGPSGSTSTPAAGLDGGSETKARCEGEDPDRQRPRPHTRTGTHEVVETARWAR